MNKIRSHLYMFKRIFKSTKFTLYLNMFIFTIDHDLWARQLMRRIMRCDLSLGQKDILKFILLFNGPISV
jgi:hypothetical protein